MKVYVVTTGEYSDYGIAKIFLDKNKAQEFADWIEESNGVNEWETADDDFEIGELKDKEIVIAQYFPYEDRFRIYHSRYYNQYLEYNKFVFSEGLVKEYDQLALYKIMPKDFNEEDKLKKILYDKWAEVKSLLVEGYTRKQINEMINKTYNELD